MLLGPKCHTLTVLFWAFWRTAEGMEGHSGYDFSWSPFRLIPFSASAAYHDFHHTTNVGNYSSFFTFWDNVLGTNSDFYKKVKSE